MANDKIKLGGLWEKDVNGKKLLKCSINDAFKKAVQTCPTDFSLEIWPNGYKKEDKQPDYIMYLAPKFKPKEGSPMYREEKAKETEFGPTPNFDSSEEIPF